MPKSHAGTQELMELERVLVILRVCRDSSYALDSCSETPRSF